MSKLTIAFLALGLVTVAVPFAAADETGADCEEDQGWIGYTSSDDVRNLYYSLLEPSDPRVNTCEGEHWDGQDVAQRDNNPGNSAGCGFGTVTDDGFGVAYCENYDFNTGGASLGEARPVTFRASYKNIDGADNFYVGVDIAGVGRAALFQDLCTTCEHQANATTGLYLRDNSDQVFSGTNVLATVVSALGLTKGYAGESDCSQETYDEAARTGQRDLCTRDNTAITVEFLLP